MTDRNDPWPAEFDPVAAVFEEQAHPGHRRDQIVDPATYAKMQAVIEAARDHMGARFGSPLSIEESWIDAALRALDGA